jgi:hypothetical protein
MNDLYETDRPHFCAPWQRVSVSKAHLRGAYLCRAYLEGASLIGIHARLRLEDGRA